MTCYFAHFKVAQMCEAAPVDSSVVKLAHDHSYVDAFCSGQLGQHAQKVIGFPWSPEFVHRTLVITGGTLAATAYALKHPGGVAGNLAGGTHHAFADRGEGYCIFNDLAVAAQWALTTGQARHVAVVDLDVHQGNGTAAMLEHVPGASTLSVHAEKNYPWKTRHPSDVDVGVADTASGAEYLAAVKRGLHELQEHWEREGKGVPDLLLFQAGVDPLKHDRLGRLALTRSDLHDRNAEFFKWVTNLEASYQLRRIPVVVTMGGGYSVPISHSARAHVDVFAQASQLHMQRLLQSSELDRAPISTQQRWKAACGALEQNSILQKAANDALDAFQI